MSFTLSRIMSTATAAYGVFALAKPGHIASGLKAPAARRPALDLLAYTYGARDLPLSLLAIRSTDPSLVTATMLLRIVGDLTDAAILSTSTTDPKVRRKVLSVTVGWAAANSLALLLDRRHVR